MTTELLNHYKEWLERIGYDFEDEFWMEDYVTDHKFRDIIELIDRYYKEHHFYWEEADTSIESLANEMGSRITAEEQALGESLGKPIKYNDGSFTTIGFIPFIRKQTRFRKLKT